MTDTNQDDHSDRQGATKSPLTPDEYARLVKWFYESTANGDEFARVSRFLNDARPGGQPKVPFLTAYRFVETTKSLASAPAWDLGEAVDYDDPELYSRDQQAAAAQGTPGRLLFLRGSPSQQWLNILGAAHRVDPEMPRRWMDTQAPDYFRSNYLNPPLPTSFWNLLELPIVTICKRDDTWKPRTQEHLDQAREASAVAVRLYLGRNSRSSGPRVLGQSVIRDVCVLDRLHLAIEQRITVCMVPAMADRTQGWTVLIWSDAGENANMCADLNSGPWQNAPAWLRPNTCHALPTTGVYRPGWALAAYRTSARRAAVTKTKKLPATAQLHVDYGRYLRSTTMARDPFYALGEVLDVAAASERQFLNLVEDLLDRYITGLNGGIYGGGTSSSGSSQLQGLPTFLYLQQVLLRHTRLIQRARESLHIIAPHARWQSGASGANGMADDGSGDGGDHGDGHSQSARVAATENYKLLHEQAQTLSVRCRESIQNLQYAYSIAESKKALEQAGRVTKLTYLASLFVPLSFTTSFFGMNLAVLDKVPVRTWIAVTAPILVLTLIVMFCDLAKLWRRIRRPVRSMWHNYRHWRLKLVTNLV